MGFLWCCLLVMKGRAGALMGQPWVVDDGEKWRLGCTVVGLNVGMEFLGSRL